MNREDAAAVSNKRPPRDFTYTGDDFPNDPEDEPMKIAHCRPWPDADEITQWDTLEDNETLCWSCGDVCDGKRPSSRYADDGDVCEKCREES